MMKSRPALAVALAALTAVNCFGWGKKGHDVTAHIAECHLTAKTMQRVTAALDGKSMVYWANWLDDASNNIDGYKHTKTWHYKNVDEGQTYESMPLNEKGDVVRAINEQTARLRSGKLSHDEEALALKMIIHFVGDMHQPMHLGHLSDLGGNTTKVYYFGRETNLHSVWDNDLPEAVHKWSYTEWQQQIDRLTDDERSRIATGTPDDWARQTLELTRRVYAMTPAGTRISYAYLVDAREIVERQLEAGGLRLAWLLNSIYDK